MTKKYRPSKEWLEDAYLVQLKTVQQIADELGCPKETVMSWLRYYGIPRRKPYESLVINGGKLGGWNKISMPSSEQIYEIYVKQRKSTPEMAKHFGVSPSTALHWLDRCGIPPRPYVESNKSWGIHRDEEWLSDQYYVKKRSMEEMGQDAGVSKKTIMRTMAELGMPRRSTSEALRKNPKRTGENNPAWRGGLSSNAKKVRYLAEYLEVSRRVKRRDKHCLLCVSEGRDPRGRDHEVHHIDPLSSAPLLAYDIGNLILLCEECHLKMRGKEKEWMKKLLELVKASEDRKLDT